MNRAPRIALAAWFALLSVSLPADALTPGQELPLFGKPAWVKGAAKIDINFATGQSYLAGAAGPLTNSRSTPSWCLTSAGALVAAAAGQNCVTDLGVASFEARTNGVRNNTMVGASVGTPGVIPTDWTITNGSGLSLAVALLGTQNGIAYVGISISGTSSSGSVLLAQDGPTVIPATYGQTWTGSVFASVLSGSFANFSSADFRMQGQTAGGTGLTSFPTSILSLESPTLGSSRIVTSATLPDTTTANVVTLFRFVPTGTVNLTLLIGLPQLELNPNLPASVASATVAGGGSGYVGASGTMTYSGAGCTTNPVLNVTTSAGAINAVTSVATAGVCPAANGLPAAGSTSWTPGGGLSVGTGASFTLVPTDNSAEAFAHPPILTAGSAVTVNADNISVATQPCANPSILASGTPSAPTSYPVNQLVAQADNGSDAQKTALVRSNSTASVVALGLGGTGFSPSPSGTWAQSVSGKAAFATAPNAQSVVFNNGTPATATAATLPAMPTTLRIGVNASGTAQFNGYISRVALACGTSLLPY